MKSKFKQKTTQPQAQGEKHLLGDGRGESTPSSVAPLGGSVDGANALLYLNSHNSDKSGKNEDGAKGQNLSKKAEWTPKSKTYKKMKCLTRNVQWWGDKLGIETLGFFTLTFKGNTKDPKEAQRRWNNLNRTISRAGKYRILVKVVEVQKRGAIHYHCLVQCGKTTKDEDTGEKVWTPEDIRTGFDFESYKKAGDAFTAKKYGEGRKWTRVYGKSAKTYLRHLWGWNAQKTESHGFGRPELIPIHYPNNIGSYLGKYLNKDDEQREKKQYDPWMTKVRKIAYGRKLPKVASANFSWVKRPNGLPTWREKVKEWAEYRGFRDMDDVASKLGKHWSHHYYEEIMFDNIRHLREAEGLRPIGERSDPYWFTAKQETWDHYLKLDEHEHTDKLKRRKREMNAFKHRENRKKFAHLWD